MSRTLGTTGQGVLDTGGKAKISAVSDNGGKAIVNLDWIMVAR